MVKKQKDSTTKKQVIKRYFSSTLRSKINIVEKDTSIICIDVNEDSEDCLPNVVPASSDVNLIVNDIVDTNEGDDSLGAFQKEWKHSTSVHCWNCCHQFQNVPIGLPINFKNGEFVCNGIFCSFNCIVRYSKDRNTYSSIKYHISHMYKTFTGKDFTELVEAPFVRCLKMFGGNLSIEEYRTSNDTKIFKYIRYPMHIVRDYIEEIDIQNLKDANDYIFKTPKSTSKKNNILDFLK